MSRKAISIVVLAVVISIVGAWALFGRKQAVAPNNSAAVQSDTKSNPMIRGADGGIEFSLNPDEVKVQLPEINGDGEVSRPADKGMGYVMVFVQAKNTSAEEKSLHASDQALVTTGGKRVVADAGLQTFIANGNWYEKIPADGYASGAFVFQIPEGDSADSIELHGSLGSEGAVLKLSGV